MAITNLEPPHEIMLGPFVCKWTTLLLTSPAHGNISVRFWEGEALLIVTHEAMHARGYINESAAECRAFALVPKLIRRMPIDKQVRQWLLQSAQMYHFSLPRSYTRCGS